MITKKQKLDGVYLFENEPFEDKRGRFSRHFCMEEFNKAGINFEIKQTNISENRKSKTLRGFHFQLPPYTENKILSCMKGSIHNIVLDLRTKSKTYLKWQSFKLSDSNRLILYVPVGCANAYMTLTDNTLIFYCHSRFYKPSYAKAIRYNDPLFKFDWPFEPEIISDKDNNIENFNPKNKFF
jgi:dTDP-4-dehydrorhamnose 3,5-epimerase|tara:strand:+ start:227 stop:772 length:546 start_codon:yes stop_codon:yes gene_type:complete